MRQGGTAVDEQVFDLALDEDGSIFLVGTTDNEISAADFLVIKLDPLGNELWMLEVSQHLALGGFPLCIAEAATTFVLKICTVLCFLGCVSVL